MFLNKGQTRDEWFTDLIWICQDGAAASCLEKGNQGLLLKPDLEGKLVVSIRWPGPWPRDRHWGWVLCKPSSRQKQVATYVCWLVLRMRNVNSLAGKELELWWKVEWYQLDIVKLNSIQIVLVLEATYWRGDGLSPHPELPRVKSIRQAWGCSQAPGWVLQCSPQHESRSVASLWLQVIDRKALYWTAF